MENNGMMQTVYKFGMFFLLNFGALALGGLFTGVGVTSDWYNELLKAPWTPPGWVFGAAWTSIMICYSFYMLSAWNTTRHKKSLLILYSIQWVLNVAWNPVFFYYHHVSGALCLIVALTLVIGYSVYQLWSSLRLKSILILPYFIWLLIATSLNGYIFLFN